MPVKELCGCSLSIDYREKHREHLVYAPNNSGLKSCKTKQWPTVNTSKQALQLGGMQPQFRGSSCLSTRVSTGEKHTQGWAGQAYVSVYGELALWEEKEEVQAVAMRSGENAVFGEGLGCLRVDQIPEWEVINKAKGWIQNNSLLFNPIPLAFLKGDPGFFFQISSGQSKFSSGNQHYHIQGK